MQIKNLHVEVTEKNKMSPFDRLRVTHLIKGLSLRIRPREIHVIMGPNGSGKSTLAQALMGNPKYKIRKGEILLDGKNITASAPDKRAALGLFLSFQHPKEIQGVSVFDFIQTAVSGLAKGKKRINPLKLRADLREALENAALDSSFLNRQMNVGCSGGEKKKLEMVQMGLLRPRYAVLDEPDSGLDIDALKTVAASIRAAAQGGCGILLITHYQRILRYLKPNSVHIMVCGKIVKSGGMELVKQLEKTGYKKLTPCHCEPLPLAEAKQSPIDPSLLARDGALGARLLRRPDVRRASSQ